MAHSQLTDWFAEVTVVSNRLTAHGPAREDLAQDALVRLIEHPPGRDNPRGWIQRVCQNLHVDGWRASARAARLALVRPSMASSNAEEDLLARERRRVVRRALLDLPRPQRRALILRFYGAWSFDRIAERLGVCEATTRTRVHRALRALRARVATLRVLAAPSLWSFKPALAVLLVLAARPAPSGLRRPAAASSRAAIAGPAEPGVRQRSVHRGSGASLAAQADTRTRAVATTSSPAPAAPRAQTMVPPAEGAVKRFDFEDDDVTGDLQQPDCDGPILAALPAVQPSLIELRQQFVPEILKSLEDL